MDLFKTVFRIVAIALVYLGCMAVNVSVAKTGTGDKSVMRHEIIRTTVQVGILTVIIVFLFSAVLMLNKIPSGSMENTIMTGDLIVSTRYDKDEINRYDIVVFKAPDDPSIYYIKRVIGLPGETITVENGTVYADGIKLEDSFIKEDMDSSGDGIYEVPEGCYFMMGDNRNESNDSRFWENKYVEADQIVAKAALDIFPFNHFGKLTDQVDQS